MNTPRTDFVAHESGDIEWNRFPNRFARMKAHAEIMERENAALLEQLVAKQEWVGLTNEDIKDIVGRNDSGGIGAYTQEMFKKIEDKLREKNT